MNDSAKSSEHATTPAAAPSPAATNPWVGIVAVFMGAGLACDAEDICHQRPALVSLLKSGKYWQPPR